MWPMLFHKNSLEDQLLPLYQELFGELRIHLHYIIEIILNSWNHKNIEKLGCNWNNNNKKLFLILSQKTLLIAQKIIKSQLEKAELGGIRKNMFCLQMNFFIFFSSNGRHVRLCVSEVIISQHYTKSFWNSWMFSCN